MHNRPIRFPDWPVFFEVVGTIQWVAPTPNKNGDHKGKFYAGFVNSVRTRFRNSDEDKGTAAKPASTLQGAIRIR
jgi:hypothetical protein